MAYLILDYVGTQTHIINAGTHPPQLRAYTESALHTLCTLAKARRTGERGGRKGKKIRRGSSNPRPLRDPLRPLDERAVRRAPIETLRYLLVGSAVYASHVNTLTTDTTLAREIRGPNDGGSPLPRAHRVTAPAVMVAVKNEKSDVV